MPFSDDSMSVASDFWILEIDTFWDYYNKIGKIRVRVTVLVCCESYTSVKIMITLVIGRLKISLD